MNMGANKEASVATLDASDDQSSEGDTIMTEVVELEPERVARNLALHLAAADGDLEECKTLLNVGRKQDADDEDEAADAWWEDESFLRFSALHFAAQGGHTDAVRLLLRCGAIWNAVNALGDTAADVAWSLNDEETYRVLFDEGVRQTLVLNLLNRQAHAESHSRAPSRQPRIEANDGTLDATLQLAPTESVEEVSAQNDAFLKSKLTFVRDDEGKMRCVDQDGGMVMAAWETDVMRTTADVLCAGETGLRVLNIGFGLGIVDECLQTFKPSRHVIVEAHADAIAFAEQNGWSKREGVELIHARWEDALDMLSGQTFDVIYWDTYAQGYGELRAFFEEVPFLLSGPKAKFSFFHGLAGTNRFLYDVYTRVSELDLREMGLDTQWHTVRPVTTTETWNGIVRKYWDLDVLFIPVAQLVPS